MTRRPFYLSAILIGVLAHLLAYVQFRLTGDKLVLYQTITHQFDILISISFVIVILLPFLKKRYYIWLAVIFRGLLYLLMSIPLNGYIGVELTLLSTLIFEIFIYTSLKGGLAYSVLLISVTLFIQQSDISAFKTILPRVSLHDTLSFCGYSVLITFLSTLLKHRQINQISLKELNMKLNEATLELAEANVQLQEYAIKVEEEAAKNERRMVAQEVHDSIAYTLTNIIMMAEAGVDITGPDNPALAEHLKKIRVQAKEGLDEVRRALKTIRAPLSTNISGLKAIKRLVDSFMEATRININLNFGNVPLYFDKKIEKTVYRLVQEGLTNAKRHGHATEINITFSRKDDWLNVCIEDNGIGCEGISVGFGLMGMQERIEALGGRIDVKSEVGKGYLLTAWIPFKGVTADEKNKSVTG
jgi:signal transduction histidine kinase